MVLVGCGGAAMQTTESDADKADSSHKCGLFEDCVIVDDLDQPSENFLKGSSQPKFLDLDFGAHATKIPGYFGKSYMFNNAGTSGSVEWVVEGSGYEDGQYEVRVHYPTAETNTADAVFNIETENENGARVTLNSVHLDQRTAGEYWIPLGTFRFRGFGAISLDAQASKEDGSFVIADAVKFKRIGD
jgi:hypothetical protein